MLEVYHKGIKKRYHLLPNRGYFRFNYFLIILKIKSSKNIGFRTLRLFTIMQILFHSG